MKDFVDGIKSLLRKSLGLADSLNSVLQLHLCPAIIDEPCFCKRIFPAALLVHVCNVAHYQLCNTIV